MSLTKLFEVQKVLDGRIVKKKGLEGQDLLPQKILALQVELGELANEWRGFKFWSENQSPRTRKQIENCGFCTGPGIVVIGRKDGIPVHAKCPECKGKGGKFKNPLLEEYVDCLHFILSIGLDIGFSSYELIGNIEGDQETTETFSEVFQTVSLVSQTQNKVHYSILFEEFLFLGNSLGFTWDQIEQAYYDKNKTNHERQTNGY